MASDKKHFKKRSPTKDKKRTSSDKKRENNKLWLSLFIIFVMVGSVFGVVFYGFATGSSRITYGDFTFTPRDNMYMTRLHGNQVEFAYVPQELEHIDLPQQAVDDLRNSRQIILTSNYSSPAQPDIATAQFYFRQTMASVDPSTFVDIAFTTQYETLPKITCQNASTYVTIILFELSNETKITTKDNCIILEADGVGGFVPLATRLLYGFFGIMQ